MKKKLLSVILCATMILASIPMVFGAAAVEYTNKIDIVDADLSTDAADAVYEISDAEDFEAFADLCIEANDYLAGEVFILTNSFTIPESYTTLANFKGTIDGQGNKISGLTAALFTDLAGATFKNMEVDFTVDVDPESTSQLNVGAFGLVTNGAAEFENVTVNIDAKIGNTSLHATYLGAFIANNKAAVRFTSCTVNGSVTIDAGTNKTTIVGAFVGGHNGAADYLYCVNNAKIDIADGAGGGIKIGGYVGATGNGFAVNLSYCVNNGDVISKAYAGGFIGDCQSVGTVLGCINTGDITVNGCKRGSTLENAYAGGLFAQIRTKVTNITQCANMGTVVAYPYDTSEAAINKTRVGGFVGCQQIASTFTDCVNYGEIKGDYCVGGFCGTFNVKEGFFVRCLSLGAISGTGENASAAAYYGQAFLGNFRMDTPVEGSYMTFTDCYYSTAADSRAVGIYTASTDTKGANVKLVVAGETYTFTKADATKTGAWDIFVEYNNFISKKASASFDALTGIAAANTLVEYEFGKVWLVTENYPVPAVLADVINGEAETPAAVGMVYEGVQYTAVSSNAFAARFVATVDKLEYSAIGFEIVRVEMGTSPAKLTRTTNEVYETLVGYDANGDKHEYTSESLNANGYFLAAISVEEIPADKTVTFIVKPIVSALDGTMAYGTAYAVVFTNGALTLQYQF